MRLLNLLLVVPILLSADCGARTGLDTVAAGFDGAKSVGGATATNITCSAGGADGANATFIGVITILSAMPNCECPNNPQCEAIGNSNGCWATLCEAAQYGFQNSVRGEPPDYLDHFCVPRYIYVCWAC